MNSMMKFPDFSSVNSSNLDVAMMAYAIDLARKGIDSVKPNPAVGCVIAKGHRVIGAGWHQKAGEGHAEVNALNNAVESVEGATAYVTLEPCSHFGRTPPCADRLIESGVARVVVAGLDPNPQVAGRGIQRLRDAGIDVTEGVLSEEARALNPGFLSKMERQRPYVRVKLGCSLDGRTAMASGESQWITGGSAREDVHRMRLRSGAVITGIGTVLADDPSMNVRLSDVDDEVLCHPMRVVLDPHLSMPLDAKMLELPGQTVVVTSMQMLEDESSAAEALIAAGAKVIGVPAQGEHLDLASVLEFLNEQDVNDVLVEAGAQVAGGFVKDGLADELVIYMAPVLMGAEARPLLANLGIDSMSDKIELNIESVRQVGSDWRWIAKVK